MDRRATRLSRKHALSLTSIASKLAPTLITDDQAMPVPPPILQTSGQDSSASAPESIHYELIKKAIPPWLANSSAQRIRALKTARLQIPDGYNAASTTTHRQLKNDIKLNWTAQNNVDQALSSLQDVYAFAKPLLQQKLK
jgi:hypothetical protein